jgi:osmotically-inducible protein OsmY
MDPADTCTRGHSSALVSRVARARTATASTITDEEFMKTDSELKTDVTRELACDTRIDETAIGISVHHGVVMLNGTVGSWAEKQAVEHAAHRVAGALDVANDVEITPSWSAMRRDADIAEAVRRALTSDHLVPDQQIRCTVADGGAVTLTGTVRMVTQRTEAERVVRHLEGVRYVVNEIAVEAPTVAASALHTTIKHALARHVAREADRITVDVQGDTVVLSGVVDSWRERRAVLGAVKGTAGVRRIDDQLRFNG